MLLMAEDGGRAEIPRIFVAVMLSSPILSSPRKSPPQVRVKHAGKGPRKGKVGVCLSKRHGSELVAIIP